MAEAQDAHTTETEAAVAAPQEAVADAHDAAVEVHTEVSQEGGLPQLNIGTYEEQLVWLFLTFVVLYLIVSRMALPRVTKVLEEREEKIAADLDAAEVQKREAEEVKAAYEAALAEARAKAQAVMVEAKAEMAAEIAKVQADLDAKLGEKTDAAEKRIAAAKAEAMASIEGVATDVTREIVTKLAGEEADDKAVAAAVKAALETAKGA